MYRVVCGDWASEPTSLEAAQYLQAKLGEGYLGVDCPKHGWQWWVTLCGVVIGCVLCNEDDYDDWIETREDARGMLYGG